jgi:hypothetical protein
MSPKPHGRVAVSNVHMRAPVKNNASNAAAASTIQAAVRTGCLSQHTVNSGRNNRPSNTMCRASPPAKPSAHPASGGPRAGPMRCCPSKPPARFFSKSPGPQALRWRWQLCIAKRAWRPAVVPTPGRSTRRHRIKQATQPVRPLRPGTGAPSGRPTHNGALAVEANRPRIAMAVAGPGLEGDASARGVPRRRHAAQDVTDIP